MVSLFLRRILCAGFLASSLYAWADQGLTNAEGNVVTYGLKVLQPLNYKPLHTCPAETALSVLLNADKVALWQAYWQEQASSAVGSELYRWVYGPRWHEQLAAALFTLQAEANKTKYVAQLGDVHQYRYEFTYSEQANVVFRDVLVFDIVFRGFTTPHRPNLDISLNQDLSRVAGVATTNLALHGRLITNPCVVSTLNQALDQKHIQLKIAGKTMDRLRFTEDLLPTKYCHVEVYQNESLFGSFLIASPEC